MTTRVKNSEIVILGAGLSGMIAAHFFRGARVIEAGEKREAHKALMRFRTTSVSEVIGIQFRKVRVYKGIWLQGKFCSPDIRIANMYSKKVIGRLANRSIWNLDPCDRYVAPRSLIYEMQENLNDVIEYNSCIESISDSRINNKRIVSTIPISVISKISGEIVPNVEYERIFVSRFEVSNSDVYQTIYFPSGELGVYRASITGELLIIESTSEILSYEIDEVIRSFGISRSDISFIDSGEQKYGKIAPMDEKIRRKTIMSLTSKYGVYSLGRFATWRNILLDDIVNDLMAIKNMMSMDNYEMRVRRTK